MKHILALLLFSASIAVGASPSFDGARISNGVFTSGTATGLTLIGSGTTFAGSKTIYVSKATQAEDTPRTGINVYDATRPFVNPATAYAAASSGDLIRIGSGTYSGQIVLRDGVNIWCDPGVVWADTSTNAVAMFTDSGTSVAAGVYGYGRFIRTGGAGQIGQSDANVLRVSGASSNIVFEYSYAERGEATQNSSSTFYITGGTVTIKGGLATSSNDAGGTLFVSGGTVQAFGAFQSSTYDAIIVGGGSLVCNQLTITAAGNPVELYGGTARFNQCTFTQTSDSDFVLNATGDGATASFEGCLIIQDGASTQSAIRCDNETNRVTLTNCSISANSSLHAVEVNESGGITLNGCRIENAGGVAMYLGTSAAIIQNCVLISEASETVSIEAPSAVNLKIYNGSSANKALDADVTQQVGAITISSDVQ